MSLTRSFLRGLKLDEEQVSAIIEAHSETVDALKAINAEVQQKLDSATESLKDADKSSEWEQKYNDLKTEYDAYKGDVVARGERAAKEKAYTDLLRENGVSEKRIATILKYDSERINGLEIDEKGTVKGAKDIAKAITADWADFITTQATSGASVATPPSSSGSAFTAEQFAKMGYNARLELYNKDPDTYNKLNNT